MFKFIEKLLNKKLFKKKESLRDVLVKEYGPEYGELYDDLNRGKPIGGISETMLFLQKLETLRKKYNL